ncbi:MAG: hypothetical protein ACI96W_003157 [Paraglaciecola sp.]|jgi:hypothetical protein
MNQFGICETSVTKNEFYSLCCLQSELLDGLSTRVVCFVTNYTEATFDEIRVPIAIKGDNFYLYMNFDVTIPSNRFNDLVCNITVPRDDIVNADYVLLLGI